VKSLYLIRNCFLIRRIFLRLFFFIFTRERISYSTFEARKRMVLHLRICAMRNKHRYPRYEKKIVKQKVPSQIRQLGTVTKEFHSDATISETGE